MKGAVNTLLLQQAPPGSSDAVEAKGRRNLASQAVPSQQQGQGQLDYLLVDGNK